VNISALVRSVTEKFRPQIAQAGVQLNLDVPDLNWLLGDEDQLVQVITNLVDNAIKYTPAGGVIGVSARPRGNYIEIRVADTGQGIDRATASAFSSVSTAPTTHSLVPVWD